MHLAIVVTMSQRSLSSLTALNSFPQNEKQGRNAIVISGTCPWMWTTTLHALASQIKNTCKCEATCTRCFRLSHHSFLWISSTWLLMCWLKNAKLTCYDCLHCQSFNFCATFLNTLLLRMFLVSQRCFFGIVTCDGIGYVFVCSMVLVVSVLLLSFCCYFHLHSLCSVLFALIPSNVLSMTKIMTTHIDVPWFWDSFGLTQLLNSMLCSFSKALYLWYIIFSIFPEKMMHFLLVPTRQTREQGLTLVLFIDEFKCLDCLIKQSGNPRANNNLFLDAILEHIVEWSVSEVNA